MYVIILLFESIRHNVLKKKNQSLLVRYKIKLN